MSAVNHPPHMAHPVTRAEEKGQEGGPVCKAAHSHSGGEVVLLCLRVLCPRDLRQFAPQPEHATPQEPGMEARIGISFFEVLGTAVGRIELVNYGQWWSGGHSAHSLALPSWLWPLVVLLRLPQR